MNETKNKPVVNLFIGIGLIVAGLALIITAFILNSFEAFKKAWYIYLMFFSGALIALLSTGEIYFYLQEKFNFKKMNVKQMCVIGIFSALSVVLYYFAKFNLPFFPGWLDIQFSELPALLISFMYGPVSGVLIIVVRFVCKLPGTSTVGVGELADLLIGAVLCIVAGLIYKRKKTFKGAMLGMACGMGSATIVAIIANWLILIPAYINLAKFPLQALVGMMNSYMGGAVTEANFMAIYLFVGVLPFNLFRYTLVFIITVLIYKKLHTLIKMITGEASNEVEDTTLS